MRNDIFLQQYENLLTTMSKTVRILQDYDKRNSKQVQA